MQIFANISILLLRQPKKFNMAAFFTPETSSYLQHICVIWPNLSVSYEQINDEYHRYLPIIQNLWINEAPSYKLYQKFHEHHHVFGHLATVLDTKNKFSSATDIFLMLTFFLKNLKNFLMSLIGSFCVLICDNFPSN